MSEITTRFFVKPIEAFQIVGRESFGSDWREECIHDEDSQHRQIALNNLQRALESGDVRAFWHDYDYERPLTAIDAAGIFFKIDLQRDCINLSFFQGEPIECYIHTKDLKAFVRSHLSGSPQSTIGDETACKNWIVDRIRRKETVQPTKLLRLLAMKEFPNLGTRAFVRARSEAIKETGAQELKKGGRPKKARGD